MMIMNIIMILVHWYQVDHDDDPEGLDDHLFERLSPRSKNLLSWRCWPPMRVHSHAWRRSRSFIIKMIMMVVMMTMMMDMMMTMMRLFDVRFSYVRPIIPPRSDLSFSLFSAMLISGRARREGEIKYLHKICSGREFPRETWTLFGESAKSGESAQIKNLNLLNREKGPN